MTDQTITKSHHDDMPGRKRKGRWADTKSRCALCEIVLVEGRPPSPCHRDGCGFAVTRGNTPFACTLTGCSLGGEDYGLIEGTGH